MCQRLKQLARELDVPVMLLAQLSRQSDGKRPGLADLRESGDIEQHADCVFLLHRPDEPNPKKDTQNIEVLVRKQRNGPIGDMILVHHKRFFEFASLPTDFS
jgi:replicative DNA helicase